MCCWLLVALVVDVCCCVMVFVACNLMIGVVYVLLVVRCLVFSVWLACCLMGCWLE